MIFKEMNMRKTTIIAVLLVMLFLTGCAAEQTETIFASETPTETPTITLSPEEEKYNEAVALCDAFRFEEAEEIFEELGNFFDAESKAEECKANAKKEAKYQTAIAFYENGRYNDAKNAFSRLEGYRDSDERCIEALYQLGFVYIEEENYEQAKNAFLAAGDYKDAMEKADECNRLWEEMIKQQAPTYQEAIKLIEEEKYVQALVKLNKIKLCKDAKTKIDECISSLKSKIECENDYTQTVVNATFLFEVRCPKNEYVRAQGGVFDGEYFYQAFTKKTDGRESAVLCMIDINGNIVKTSEELEIHHANAISDMGDGTLIISDYATDENGDGVYTIVDKETLTIVKKGSIPDEFLSLDYCPELNLYSRTGIGYGAICGLLDEKLNEFFTIDQIAYDKSTAPQNFRFTKDGLYSARYFWNNGIDVKNYIYLYDIGMALQKVYAFDVGQRKEIQSVSVVGGKVYAQFENLETHYVAVYEIDIPV